MNPTSPAGGDILGVGGIIIPAAALSWRFSRGTGPGGQGVNTTDSRVELLVDLAALAGNPAMIARVRSALGDHLRIVVATERSQLRNRAAALDRLVKRVDAAATPRRRRRATRPTTASVTARLQTKAERARLKAKRQPPRPDE